MDQRETFMAWLDALPAQEAVPVYEVLPAEIRWYVTPIEDPVVAVQQVPYQTISTAGRDLSLRVFGAHRGARRAAVLFIHGGGWLNGFSELHDRQASLLASEGYFTASVEYRLAGEAPWPAQLDDCQAALDWIAGHAHDLGVDPARIAVAGASAGGHIAALLACNRDPGPGLRPRAAVLWSPVTDLARAHLVPELAVVVRDNLRITASAEIDRASPLAQVGPWCPPILSIHGDLDSTVPLERTREFHRRLSACGVPNRLLVMEGRGHAVDFGPLAFKRSMDSVRGFLNQWVRGPSGGGD